MKKIIDKKGRLFGVISVIDIVVIAVILLVAAGVYVKFFVLDKTAVSAPLQDVKCQVTVYELDNAYVDGLRAGDTVYDQESGAKIGVITDVSAEPAMVVTKEFDGSVVSEEKPGYSDVTLLVTAECTQSSDRYYASRTFELSVNKATTMDTKYLEFKGMVTEIG